MSKNRALVVIDLQNDIAKNYKEIIGNVNEAIDRAVLNGVNIIYVRHNNLSDTTRTFKPGSRGADFVSELKIVSDNVFTKTKSNALSSEEFVSYIREKNILEFFIVGADATACIKSTCLNLRKENYDVHVLSDCITSYDKNKLPDMREYYKQKGCVVENLADAKL